MNFLPAQLVADGAGFLVDTGAFRVAAPSQHHEKLRDYAGKDVVFGVRPGDVFDASLTRVIDATDENTVEAQVDVTEPMGEMTVAYLTIGNQQLVAGLSSDTRRRRRPAAPRRPRFGQNAFVRRANRSRDLLGDLPPKISFCGAGFSLQLVLHPVQQARLDLNGFGGRDTLNHASFSSALVARWPMTVPICPRRFSRFGPIPMIDFNAVAASGAR